MESDPMVSRRDMLAAAAAAALAAVPSLARARAGWPDRPVRMVVPFAAGGIIDVVARIIAEPLGREIGQAVVVENLPGAGSTIGARAVARAAPDGHTLLLNGAAHPVIPALTPTPASTASRTSCRSRLSATSPSSSACIRACRWMASRRSSRGSGTGPARRPSARRA
jgi:tripartite-type tricarboxylate transporter receptor subunit TctC